MAILPDEFPGDCWWRASFDPKSDDFIENELKSLVMKEYPYGHTVTPLQVAATYLVFGFAWIVLSDYVVFALVDSPTVQTQVQTVKGWGFVTASGVLIYGLTTYSYTQLQEANEELTEALQQTHVLHRILRHNLRNKCNVIAGIVERLHSNGGVAAVEIIERQITELIDLSEKSRLLRNISLVEHRRVEVDLVHKVNNVVTDIEATHSDVGIQTDLPDEAVVTAHPDIQQAIHELVINGIKHGAAPIIVRVSHENATGTSVAVIDHGPGLPAMERAVLEEGFIETQTYHSRGLGLWLVRALMSESNGTVTVESNNGQGTTVRLTFEPASKAVVEWFFR